MDDAAVLAVIKDFVDAPTLQDARVVLEQHQSTLLSDQADKLLRQMVWAFKGLPMGKNYMPGGGNYVDHLERRRTLLQRCRAVGIPTAWVEYARMYPR